jgi:UDPglucose 6-dehydrogenase
MTGCFKIERDDTMDVAVIGLGKLGSPLAAVLASKGHSVIGIDLNVELVKKINAGIAPVAEPELQHLISTNRALLRATTDFREAIPNSDISFVIVPTPSDPDGGFTNQYVVDAVRRIGDALRNTTRYHVVNITSTVMPGSTGGEIRAALEHASRRVVDQTVGLVYNPEFVALGTVVRDLLRPDMILIGESDSRAGDALLSVYRTLVENEPSIQRMNWINAEITKLAVNTYVTTKISYANMIGEVCDNIQGADVDVVTAAVGKDSRIGSRYLKGALGYGGPCFPRDNRAFAALARSIGTSADIAVATDTINQRQVDRIIRIARRLVTKGASIAVLGMAYKPDTTVVEESQGVMIARRLAESGFQVLVHDPHELSGLLPALLLDKAVPVEHAADAIRQSELVVITTASSEYANIPAEVFCVSGRRCTVLDCWRILSRDIGDVANVIYLGYCEGNNGTLQRIRLAMT